MKAVLFKAWLLIITGLFTLVARAATPEFTIEIRDHLFLPSLLIIPANTKVKLIVHNLDSTAEEFESYELNREKVIMGGAKAIIFVGPLPPGDYPFFGEFFPKTAQGVIRVAP
jgi:Cupredoxin-like domain